MMLSHSMMSINRLQGSIWEIQNTSFGRVYTTEKSEDLSFWWHFCLNWSGMFKALHSWHYRAAYQHVYSVLVTMSVLVSHSSWSLWDCLHPWKMLPCKGFQEEKVEHPSSPHRSMHAHVHCVTTECSALADVCGRGLTRQAAPALASGLLSFSHSKCPKACLPFKTPEGRQCLLRQIRWGAEERTWSQQAEQPFLDHFKLPGARTLNPGEGSADVLCLQFHQPVFRKGAPVPPLNIHWYPTRLLHRKFYTHISVPSPDLSWKSWGGSAETAFLPPSH